MCLSCLLCLSGRAPPEFKARTPLMQSTLAVMLTSGSGERRLASTCSAGCRVAGGFVGRQCPAAAAAVAEHEHAREAKWGGAGNGGRGHGGWRRGISGPECCLPPPMAGCVESTRRLTRRLSCWPSRSLTFTHVLGPSKALPCQLRTGGGEGASARPARVYPPTTSHINDRMALACVSGCTSTEKAGLVERLPPRPRPRRHLARA